MKHFNLQIFNMPCRVCCNYYIDYTHLLSSADNVCKQFVPRSESKLFGNLVNGIFLKKNL